MLRNYTHNSLQRSYLKPKQLVKAAKEKGWEFVGICDENTLSGMVEFYKECKENDIKPVIGCEFWVDDKKFPLFALNRKGLNRMISACSKIGCGEKLTKKDIDDLRFDKNIVEHHDIITARYIEGDEREFELVITANKNARPEDIEDLIKNSTFVKGYDSEEWLKEVKQKVVDKVKDYELASRPILTSFPCPDGLNEDEYVRELCRNGWKDKLIPSGKVDSEENKKKYADRVKYELDVLQGAGLSGYFLVVWDVVNYVREKGWLPGPGRGCFLPDTRVKMADGSYSPIATIKIGDKVVDSYGNIQEVENLLEYDVDEEIIELEFENEKIVRCTKDHKFLTSNRGWVQAKDLDENDEIVEV